GCDRTARQTPIRFFASAKIVCRSYGETRCRCDPSVTRNRTIDHNRRAAEDFVTLCTSLTELNASSARGVDSRAAARMATVYLSCCARSEILSIKEASGFWESPGRSCP